MGPRENQESQSVSELGVEDFGFELRLVYASTDTLEQLEQAGRLRQTRDYRGSEEEEVLALSR
jgi:hypothetical protein